MYNDPRQNIRRIFSIFFRRRRSLLPDGVALSPRAKIIFRERPDLGAAFDITTPEGEAAMLGWYLRHGFGELQLMPDEDEVSLVSGFSQPYPGLAQSGFLPITWLMHVMAGSAPESHRLRLRDEGSYDAFLSWFFVRGLTDAHLEGFLSPSQADILLAPDRDHPAAPCLFVCMWKADARLQSSYASPEDTDFLAWCRNEAVQVFPILSHPLVALATAPVRTRGRGRPFGVNLIGHVRSRSGVSEDVRAAMRVLEAAGIDYAVRDVHPGASMGQDEEVSGVTDGDLPYAITMFCMTAEAILLAKRQIGPAVFRDHYVIGFWPWELPELPTIWRHAYDLVDEVWASSAFSHAAFSRSAPIPVRAMPMAVMTEEASNKKRSDFDLPADRFLFGFAFDGLSGFARKAPHLCVEAFRRAFPDGREKVGLVIKTMRVQGDPRWQDLMRMVEEDPRIHLLSRSLTRAELLDLWRTFDCFLSLHRSEGFGRNIAEAMRLGVPVIATAHSGNMDFTNHETAALVPVRLKPVEAKEYSFGEGQLWAEPDVDRAAANMQHMVEDVAWRERIARNGQRWIEDHYDAAQVAKAWTSILQSIYVGISDMISKPA